MRLALMTLAFEPIKVAAERKEKLKVTNLLDRL
jgi:hypothetical protein